MKKSRWYLIASFGLLAVALVCVHEPYPTRVVVRVTFLQRSYDPPVDIDNDGTPDDVLMWSSYDRHMPSCGEKGSPQFMRGDTDGLVLSKDGQVDRAKTLAVFGRSGVVPGVPTITELGTEFGVFKYRDLVYFDTFGDPNVGTGPGNQLTVF